MRWFSRVLRACHPRPVIHLIDPRSFLGLHKAFRHPRVPPVSLVCRVYSGLGGMPALWEMEWGVWRLRSRTPHSIILRMPPLLERTLVCRFT
jgi:hypothetical protein